MWQMDSASEVPAAQVLVLRSCPRTWSQSGLQEPSHASQSHDQWTSKCLNLTKGLHLSIAHSTAFLTSVYLKTKLVIRRLLGDLGASSGNWPRPWRSLVSDF